MIQIVLLSPKSRKDQKKGPHRKLNNIYPKTSLPQFGTIFRLNWWDLIVLTGTFCLIIQR